MALIARGLMISAAPAAADDLLDAGGPQTASTFAAVANCADSLRFFHRETATWHFDDIEIAATEPFEQATVTTFTPTA